MWTGAFEEIRLDNENNTHARRSRRCTQHWRVRWMILYFKLLVNNGSSLLGVRKAALHFSLVRKWFLYIRVLLLCNYYLFFAFTGQARHFRGAYIFAPFKIFLCSWLPTFVDLFQDCRLKNKWNEKAMLFWSPDRANSSPSTYFSKWYLLGVGKIWVIL